MSPSYAPPALLTISVRLILLSVFGLQTRLIKNGPAQCRAIRFGGRLQGGGDGGNSQFGFQRLRPAARRGCATGTGKSRLKDVPPIVGLRRRIFVHVGGRSANGSQGATFSRQPIAIIQSENCWGMTDFAGLLEVSLAPHRQCEAKGAASV